MLDILAALDAAIDELAPAATSRNSRGSARSETATGTCKYLTSKPLPVLPVVPVPERGVHGPLSKRRNNSVDEKIGSGPHKYIYFSTGSTGTTGSIEDSCGVQRVRDGNTQREVTGTTGTATELDFDRLDPARPPGDVPQRRWAQFLNDARNLCASGFAAQAKALGWTAVDLFGCHDTRPFARIDCLGLVWLLNGNRIVALTAESAAIETKDGARLTFRKQEQPGGDLRLLLATATPSGARC